MSLHRIAKEQGIIRKDTCKLFWREYAYSLKALIPEYFIEERREALHAFWLMTKDKNWSEVQPPLREIHAKYKATLQKFIDDIIDKNLTALTTDDFYYLASDKNVSFYVKSEEIVEVLIQNNPYLFVSYSAPRSRAVEEHLISIADKKEEVRQNPYYGEFDYRITFKWRYNFTDLDQRILSLQFNDSVYSQGLNRILYVKGDDDFFLAKIALNDQIETVTKCTTIREIENNS